MTFFNEFLTIKKNCHRYYFLNTEYINELKNVAKIPATLPPFNAFFDGLNDILIRNHVYRISYFLSWKAFNTPPRLQLMLYLIYIEQKIKRLNL